MRNSTSQKIAIIKEVIEEKKSIYSVCKKYNLSKMTFYKWLAIYKKARKNRHASLANNIKKGNDHYKSLGSAIKFKVLSYVHNNPNLSCHQIAQRVGVGNHAVQNLLEKEGLNLEEQRVEYSKKPFWKRETQERRQGMMELYEQGWMIDSICRHYKISKTTFFKWRQRYLEAKELGMLLALGDRYVSGNVHHKYIDESVKDKVVEIVAQNPDWSVHRIAASVAQSGGKPVIGHHAIQDLLLVKDLNTIEKRRLYAQGYVRQLAPAIQIYDTPVPSLSVWRLLFAPFKTVPKWVFGHPASWPIVFPVTIFLAWIIEVDKLINPVFFFPTVALTFGMFFFLYSLKYYFSLIMVMKVAQIGDGSQSESGQMSMPARFFSRFVSFAKISKPISQVNTLTLKLDNVELRTRPFVSIHTPIYNEKRVVERLIKACSSQKWFDDVSGKANFEVVIVDDSTDNTTEIIKQFLRDNYGELRLIRDDKGTEIYRVDDVPHLPSFTLIHRATRSGYKGAALGNAMSFIDQRAQYVCVFDADFVPYPDTIEQFMKSFQEACGGLEKVAESKIAAVQGYQWHVLNKSENWVTRGVRTEYAGSYVVERAGIGIYGGLNQIAGSVFCIRADVLKVFGWRTSITEDLQLTLRLYEQGFKVVFNPYIQAPAEAVSTVRRLIRQRMRWAEGHTFNVKQMWLKMMYSKRISGREKFEFLYLAPYYLQAAFFLIGVSAWFISEVVLHTRLPFWTAAWGWSLVFTNFLALPLMNLAGLFLEESEEKDYVGVASFMLLSYVVVPFQAYAAVKALFETEEGPWFRTPKTGLITDNFDRGKFYGWIEKLKMIGGAGAASSVQCAVQSAKSNVYGGFGGRFSFARVTAHNPLSGYRIMPKRAPRVSRGVIASLVIVVLLLNSLAFLAPNVKAVSSTPALEQQLNIKDAINTPVSSGTYAPTDESQGLVNWDSSKYSGTVTTKFEAVAKVTGTDGNVGKGTSIFCFSTTDCSIAYYDVSARALKYAHCTTATCASPAPTITTIDGLGCALTNCDTTADVGQFPSVSCWTANTQCAVSYYDATNGNLKYLDCQNTNCTTTTSVQTLDSTGDVGAGTSISCIVSHLDCGIVYRDSTNSALKYLICGYVFNNCDSTTIKKVDGVSCTFTSCSTTASVGEYPSLSIVLNGTTYVSEISYYDSSNGDLKYARCTADATASLNCNGSTKVVTVESTNDVGRYTSITCLTSIDCKIAHYDNTNGDLRFIDCGDADCATGNTASLLDGNTGCTLTTATACSTTANVGQYTSIYCPSATTCKISYYDVTNGDLKLANCVGSATCAAGTDESPFTTNTVGQYTSLSCTSSTACQIVHYDASSGAGDLLFFNCSVAACTNAGGTSTKIDAGTARFWAGLFASGSQTAIVGSEISFTSTSYARVRSAGAITLTTGTNYTVRFHTDGMQTGSIAAARVIITQTASGSITSTQAQVEVGDKQSITGTTYADLANKKFYCYSGNATCASTTVWTPAPTVYFEATIQNSDASTGVTDAQLYDITAAAAVTNSAITLTGASATTYTRVRSSAITLTAGHQYKVQVKVANFSGNIVNAKIILDQSTPTGITATEVVQTYNNTKATGTTTAYVSLGYPNNYTSANFSGTVITRYLDTTHFWTQKSGSANGSVQLDTASPGTVTTSSTTPVLARAAITTEPTDADHDAQAKIDAGSGTSTTNVTNLVIQMSSMPVPEASLLLLPLALFLPFIVKRLGLRKKDVGFLEVSSG